jgi:hypothetical protein
MPIPAQGEFGSNGSYSFRTDSVPSPLWSGHDVVVYSPTNIQAKAPVIFYSHAYGATDPDTTAQMFKNLASRGYIVVFSPYPTFGSTVEERYQTLWEGFKAAVETFGDRMDLSKVGYVGWSFGGGATPAMAHRGITKEGWGSSQAFMYIMAPWYSYNISQNQLANFPKHVNLVMQVFDEDSTNDHRMAIDIFRNIGIPPRQKNFLTVYSEHHSGCSVVADHTVPSDKKKVPFAMRAYSIFRVLDALAAYTFDGNQEALRVALGNGSAAQTSMGTWTPMTETSDPVATHPESYYKFVWSDDKNLRLGGGNAESKNEEPPPEKKRKGLFRKLFQ